MTGSSLDCWLRLLYLFVPITGVYNYEFKNYICLGDAAEFLNAEDLVCRSTLGKVKEWLTTKLQILNEDKVKSFTTWKPIACANARDRTFGTFFINLNWQINVDLKLGESCNEDNQCIKTGYNRHCDRTFSICSCINGFTEINGHCLKSGLKVNDTCLYDEQCNKTTNSTICREHVCVCMTDYIYKDGICQPFFAEITATDWSQGRWSKTTAALLNPENNIYNQTITKSNIRHLIVAASAGFTLGILGCLSATLIINRCNRKCKYKRCKKLPIVNNVSYENDVNFSPHMEAEASFSREQVIFTPEYTNVGGTEHGDSDTYNHLHERTYRPDTNDYDHVQHIRGVLISRTLKT
ncbi:uncharacterized protein LOC134266760 isoform X2 [Saccostrea cucullata]|uniref:uncharacterized protein LOC134266760 isoform X2 n=1 Tax=Saccostrea cuccullata TaxID=36930 RepID=UPI002ED45AEA